jgi:ubiquinone/menaquinone biosynthesis C-methylase UbiE
VKRQYESFPYPPRDPSDEWKRLITSIPASLLAINHHCFGGKKDFRTGFRCLVAGGGTGDSTIFLAEQLRNYDAEVVYLDFSDASRKVAEARASVRKLGNITWVTASIMELPELGLGEFDYVECSGVLHHLESTERGLGALNAVLKDDGAIFLMVYAKYGRQSVYDMQTLLRNYLPEGAGMREKVQLARNLLEMLPRSNSFIRDLAAWSFEISEAGFGDAGLYDLLLHSQDRCFDVPELYALAKSAGLHLLSFAWRADDYDPLKYLNSDALRDGVAPLDLRKRQALAEMMVGDIRMHEFFLARQPNRTASLADDSLAMRSYGLLLANAARIAAEMVPAPGAVVNLSDQRFALSIACTPVAKVAYAHMDGASSLQTVRQRAQTVCPGMTPEMVNRELEQIYAQLHAKACLYLLAPGSYGVGIPDYEKLLAGSRPGAPARA